MRIPRDTYLQQLEKNQVEVDFVITKGPEKLYIQSTLSMDSEEKKRQGLRPLYAIKDNLKQIVITKTHAKPWTPAFFRDARPFTERSVALWRTTGVHTMTWNPYLVESHM